MGGETPLPMQGGGWFFWENKEEGWGECFGRIASSSGFLWPTNRLSRLPNEPTYLPTYLLPCAIPYMRVSVCFSVGMYVHTCVRASCFCCACEICQGTAFSVSMACLLRDKEVSAFLQLVAIEQMQILLRSALCGSWLRKTRNKRERRKKQSVRVRGV